MPSPPFERRLWPDRRPPESAPTASTDCRTASSRTAGRRPRLAVATRGLAALLAAAATVASAQPPGEPWLNDVTTELGIDFRHVRALEERFWFPEIMSGGAGWLDYDDDGDLDLYLVQGGAPPGGETATAARPVNRLYRNDGAAGFVDVTARAGVGDGGYGMGVAVGDVDGDGATDLYVTNVGPNALFINRGDGSFRRAAAGVDDPGWGSSAAFADLDLDGDLDLFLVNYVAWSAANEVECFSGGLRDYCHPSRYRSPQADRLFLNHGDGRFTDVSDRAGLGRAFGNGLGVAIIDFDEDGLPDVYVANDGMPNQLWVNRGEGRFVDHAVETGCAVNAAGAAEAGMGVAVGDADGDGREDLLLTHLRQETHTLYLLRDGFCEDATARFGLAAASINRTGFGAGLVDFDHDGALDLFVANGRVGLAQARLAQDDPFAEPDQLFAGAAGRFIEVRHAVAGAPIDNGRAAAFGDFDGDGAVDVVVANNGGSARLLRNRAARGAWLRLRFRDAGGSGALGARVSVVTDGGRRVRRLESAWSYCAANEAAVHAGLGEGGGPVALEVVAPGGARRQLRRLAAGRVFVLFR